MDDDVPLTTPGTINVVDELREIVAMAFRYNVSNDRFEVSTSPANEEWIDARVAQRCPVCNVNVDMVKHLGEVDDEKHAVLVVMRS